MEKKKEETYLEEGEKISVSVAADGLCEGQQFSTQVISLAKSRASLKGGPGLQVGSRFTLWLVLPNPEASALEPLELTGEVVSIAGDTVEVNFVALSPQDQAIITEFIQKTILAQRRSPRVSVGLKVDYKYGETWATGQIGNISEGGMLLLTQSPIPLGEQLMLQFLPPDILGGRPIRVMGEVTRAARLDPPEVRENYGVGVGIRFKGVHSQSKADFSLYIKKLTEALEAGKSEAKAPPKKVAEVPPKKVEKKAAPPAEPEKKSVFESIWKHLTGKK